MQEPLIFEPIAGLPQWRACHVASTGSTSADLMALAARGRAGEGRLWLTAGAQSAGRGRRGRSWSSPTGNLYASTLLIDPASADRIGTLPLVAAVAMRDAIAAELGEGPAQVQLKWPNDVLIDGAKCCGILLEAAVMPDGRQAIVIGCGTNITGHPLDTGYPATHLKAHAPASSAQTLFHHMVEQFAATLSQWDRGRNLPVIRERWLSHARGLGKKLSVNLSDRRLDGVFEAIDAEGQLILRMTDGTHKRLAAGDVFF